MSNITILHGDSLDLLKTIADNSIDSVCTDSPYGFGKEPDPLKVLPDWIDHGYHEIKGTGFMGKKWDSFVPQPILWKEIFRVLKPGGYVLAFFGTRTYDWGTMAIRLAGFQIRDMMTWNYGSGFPKSLNVSKALDAHLGFDREKEIRSVGDISGGNLGAKGDSPRVEKLVSNDMPVSDEAKLYDGYGTALKPAIEPICVARKPLDGTVAQNFLKWGIGGLNIDACRIEFSDNESDPRIGTDAVCGTTENGFFLGLKNETERQMYNDGRFPSNFILDPEAAAILDQQTGVLKSGYKDPAVLYDSESRGIYGADKPRGTLGYGDSGGASRFFYCAKASKEERNAGLEGFAAKITNDGRKTDIDNAFQRGVTERLNDHPTIKPIALMRYLQRLVTPKGGTTLDPFAGSGTSGCSAAFEEIDCILMERETSYIPIIEARTAYWSKVANRERYIQSLKDSQITLF